MCMLPLCVQLATYVQRIDPRVRCKISELVADGVDIPDDIQSHLRQYVAKELFLGEKPPAKTHRTYYPSTKDIHNYVSYDKSKSRFNYQLSIPY